jgi:hypothetical protein
MGRPYIPESLRRVVAEQAMYRCGYCQTAQAISGMKLHVEHILPVSLDGQTVESNLWLACAMCNDYKGAQTHAIDPISGERVPLFNPRTQKWSDHFVWSEDGIYIIGQTPCGRASVDAIQLNNEYVVIARKNWVKVGWHPPRQ